MRHLDFLPNKGSVQPFAEEVFTDLEEAKAGAEADEVDGDGVTEVGLVVLVWLLLVVAS